jgi:hypothetical protein
MEPETKAAFTKVVADHAARTKVVAAEQDKRVTQRKQFEAEFRRLRDDIIIPALKEVAHDVLEPAGWTCQVRAIEERTTATLEVYRGAMMSLAGRERPHIDFVINAHAPKLEVHASSQSQGGPEGSHSLNDISADLVHKKVLQFFQRLASGR